MHTAEISSIPKYPLEPDAVVGNKMFRINRNDNVVNYLKSDFLVPHRKDYYFFAFVKQGCSRHWIDMVPYTLAPNTFYFTVPHQVHLKEEAKPMTGISMGFTKEFLNVANDSSLFNLPIIQNMQNAHALTLSDGDVVFIEDVLNKIFNEYHSHSDWQNNMLHAYIKVLLIYTSRLYTEQFQANELLQDKVLLKRYLAKIDELYSSQHDVAAYADALNISAGHLGDIVKEQSGKPAIAHIHERLILEAKRLIFHTDLAIKEIAFELGFEDASYFNRFFKRLSGQTPIEYRIAIREMYH
ncbi:MAG: AraC family transcriptional regulator [Sphingobacteriales bacterium]|nr:MAG: AraC family transcriptional regulator [Sphingobacteriales bacterium]